jgi:hypothetical protein
MDGIPSSVVCTICKVILSAHSGVLKGHARSMQHRRNMQMLIANTGCNIADGTESPGYSLDLKVSNVSADSGQFNFSDPEET